MINPYNWYRFTFLEAFSLTITIGGFLFLFVLIITGRIDWFKIKISLFKKHYQKFIKRKR